MRLRDALNIGRGEVVAFTGAGGKTSAMVRLADELVHEGWRVVCTTTTRIAADEMARFSGRVKVSPTSLRPAAISRALNQHGQVFLYSAIHTMGETAKVIGVPAESIAPLLDGIDSDAILIEADGSRRLSFKAPYDHEPVIPLQTTLCVPTVGLSVVGKPLTSDYVYNPQFLIDRYGYVHGEKVRWAWVAAALRDPDIALKGVPDAARVMGLINQVPPQGIGRNLARLIARLALRDSRLEAVITGGMQQDDPIYERHKRIAAVVLAGGLSRRMQQPDSSKVLLAWEGNKPIIRVIADKLKRMRLDEIVVVTGHVAAKVKEALYGEPVKFAHNRAYREGDMLSSLQTGLRALPENIAACLVVLGDQPQLDPRVVTQVVQAYAEGRGRIVAPSYGHRRGHPILIDRAFWAELFGLPAGGAPRDVINAHADEIYHVNVETDSILRDIDTPEDYQDARRKAGLE